eukprot:15319596-Alexandrium_andersonii.AAC.1
MCIRDRPFAAAQSASSSSSEAMKYCAGPFAPALAASPASSEPNADGPCSAGPDMVNASSPRGCRSSSMRGRSTPAASKW